MESNSPTSPSRPGQPQENWKEHYVTDGFRFRGAVLRECVEYISQRWRLREIAEHPVLHSALWLARIAVVCWILYRTADWLYVDYRLTLGRGLRLMSLGDCVEMVKQAPIAWILAVGLFSVRFRSLVFWLKRWLGGSRGR